MNRLFIISVAVQLSATVIFSQSSIDNPIQDAQALLAQKPILFQENKGQVINVNGELVSSVLFKTAVAGIDAYITSNGLVYVFNAVEKDKSQRITAADPFERKEVKPHSIEMEWLQVHLEGADIRPENIVKELPGKTDYRFFTTHFPGGITAKAYEKITIREVYPGIDWVLYGSSKTGMKYDFIVHPGADASRIRLLYEGERPPTIDSQGNIQQQMRWGNITENAPVSFVGNDHKEIKSAFKSEIAGKYSVRISYDIEDYDKSEALTIDPQLTWGTRFGGNQWDYLRSVTHDSNDNLFISGETESTTFPVLDAGTYFQSGITGTNLTTSILKFDNNGVLLWSTLYGGNGTSTGTTIACDNNDNVFVAGHTTAANFPLQNSGTYFQSVTGSSSNLFILKFDNAGNRLWATGYDGSADEFMGALTCDPNGNVFVAGITNSSDLPTQNAGTYFQAYAGGGAYDAFILKFDNAGNRLWATYYGGTDNEIAHAISCDATGNLFLSGTTASLDLPVQNAGTGTYFQGTNSGEYDIFLLKFNNAGNRLWATYYGGNLTERGLGIATDANGNVFVAGLTGSSNFPVWNAGTYFDGMLGGTDDEYILKFDNAGNRLWATYYGGSAPEGYTASTDILAFDLCGNVYVLFNSESTDITTLDPGSGSYFVGTNNTIPSSPAFFLTHFTNDGDPLWATFLGGPDYTGYASIETDSSNNLFLVGDAWGDYAGSGLLVNPGNGAYFDNTLRQTSDGYIFKFIPESLTHTSSQTPAGCNCVGSATVTITGGGLPPYNYIWSNGIQLIGTNTTSITINNLCAGNYWVLITSASCTADTVFFNLSNPGQGFTANDTTICLGSCVNFFTNPVANATYSWDFGDGQTSTQVNPTHCYTTAGNYTVGLTVTDGQCISTDTKTNYIDVYPSPVAAIGADPLFAPITAPTVNFTEQASGENSWLWNFGDALPGQSNLPNPSYTYAEIGNYVVSLTVANQFGCTSTTYATIVIFDFALDVPNVLVTSSKSGNNLFFVNSKGIDKFKCTIVNRWGNLVYEYTDPAGSWNGTNKGQQLVEEGTYFYFIEATSKNGEEIAKQGFIEVYH